MRLAAGAQLPVPATYEECGFYVVGGSVDAGGHAVEPGQLAVLSPGAGGALRAQESSELMLLAGDRVGPRFIEWNFVSSSAARIEQAKADWRAGRMKLPDADDAEFIPLPDDGASRPRP